MIGLPFLALSVMTDQVKANKGFILKTNGDVVPFDPTVKVKGDMTYDLNAVRTACNFDYVEIVYLNDDMILLCDEEGLLKGNPQINVIATKLYQVSANSNEVGIVGNCVLCHTKAVK